LNLRKIRNEHFQVVGGAYYLSDDGRTTVLAAYEDFRNEEVAHPLLGRTVGRWALPTVQATLMARFLRGDLPVYPPYTMAA
jgi:CRISPR-associated protein Cas1